VLNNIFALFSKQSWEMWGALGQWAGAIGTVWAVTVALKQTKIGLKQTQLAIEQMEDARKKEEETRVREKEAMKPELTIEVRTFAKEDVDIDIRIFLTNTKQIPAYIYEYELVSLYIHNNNVIENAPEPIISNQIITKVPQLISFGAACITEIPLSILVKSIKSSHDSKGLFRCRFLLTTGDSHTISILIEYAQYPYTLQHFLIEEEHRFWNIYACFHRVSKLEEIRTEKYLVGAYMGLFSYIPTN
jgi:hypothetical protein